MTTSIAIARGDGIGPEIMAATLRILDAAGADLDLKEIELGARVYERGVSSGIESDAWDVVRGTQVLLKAPITTPLGGGFKSLNVTLRKSLGLYANVRPCPTYDPFIRTAHPGMDVVVVRENEEDLYAGIEHQQTDEVVQCLKLVSRPGTERIVRYAFEYARLHGRRRVSAFTKSNIMKLTDGLFASVFEEVAADYPDIEHDHWIVDIGAAMLADQPERFDVIVTPNLYGDIVSDIAAQISGSVGIGGSANIGDHVAMFEAVHGSAPTIAGQDVANPSGLLLASVQMLVHVGLHDVAARVHNAWLTTIEEGVHTADVADRDGATHDVVGTQAFADAVVDRLGRAPSSLEAVSYPDRPPIRVEVRRPRADRKTLVGVDAFLHWWDGTPDDLGALLEKAVAPGFELVMITNRGQKVYPNGLPETFCTDHWRCRFQPIDGEMGTRGVVELLGLLADGGFDVVKTENLYEFDGRRAYSLGQGQ
ncbi:MAG: NADP-dependent isocitrate dehydrogenase [Acidimicrobiia bacterium]|nr:NADP-dependent isocitrate dehydrogenase [Acidimicrobiia bacterium]